jgi:LacI family transcriptional regulator
MDRLLSLNIPTVLVGNTMPHIAVDAVTSENYDGGYQATRHLIDHGHQDILFLSGPKEWVPVQERIEGYKAALHEQGYTPRIEYIPYTNVEKEFERVLGLLQEHPTTTAVFAKNDPLALMIINIARKLGRQIPEDLALIGYDNLPWSETAEPPVTTVNIHKVEMGRLAARRILDILQEEESLPLTIRVYNELIVRRSCGCPYP